MRSPILVSLLVYLCLAADASAGETDSLAGYWRTVRHGALVKIADCGDGTPCGALAWVSEAISEGNVLDIRNRDPALRDQLLIGAPILWGFSLTENEWRDGLLYNPEDGKTFRAHLRLLSHSELQVSGCIGPFCRSQIWTRSAEPSDPVKP
ncbi:MAG: DUF2147 domain-containing protein [Parvibaculum sp.]